MPSVLRGVFFAAFSKLPCEEERNEMTRKNVKRKKRKKRSKRFFYCLERKRIPAGYPKQGEEKRHEMKKKGGRGSQWGKCSKRP